MRIVWVTRSFLDYRIPVYNALSRLAEHDFYLVFGDELHINPPRVVRKVKDSLGKRAIALKGERCIGKPYDPSTQSNAIFRYFYQPGLGRVIKSLHPDVLITDAFNHWTIPVLLIRIFFGVKHIMCYERTKHTERDSPSLKIALRKLSFRWIDHIVCNGSLCAEYIEWLGYPRSKISLGNMAADTTSLQENKMKFSEHERHNLKNKLGLNKYVFIFIGRLVSLKGVDKLIKAWKDTIGQNNVNSLLIVGDGPEKSNLEKMSKESGCSNIHFTGSVDYDFIYKYFSIADILVMPTLQDNWSLVVPEAMSCALPVICSKYNGCWPELVKPENGWVFDPLDHKNFSETLKTAWDNLEKWKSMGQKSLQIVQYYSPEKVADSIYSACLKVPTKR